MLILTLLLYGTYIRILVYDSSR